MARKKKQNKATKSTNLIPSGFMALALLVIIPLVYSKSVLDPVLYPRFTAWAVSLVLLVALLWFYKKSFSFDLRYFKSGFFYAFLSFFLISIGSLLWAVNPVEGLTDIFKWLLFGISVFLAVNLLQHFESTLEIIFKAVVVNAGFAVLIGFYQYFTTVIGNPDPNAIYEMKGLMAHKNQFSISLLLMLPFLFSSLFVLEKNWKKLNIIELVSILLFLIILQTRAVWIALIFAGALITIPAFISMRKKGILTMNKGFSRKLVLSFVVILALFLIFIFAFPGLGFVKSITTRVSSIFDLGFSSNEWRLQMWEATYNLFRDNKLIGVGAGNWKISIYPYYGEYLPSVFKHWRNPHNDFLGIASEKGFFGLLAFISLFMVLIYYSVRLIFKSKEKTDVLVSSFMLFGLLGFLIVSFFSFPAERMNHLIFVALISAILICKYFELGAKEKTEQKPGFLFIAVPMIILLYLPLHFGIINLNSETQMTKVLVLKDKKKWNQMEKYVDKANSVFAPLEPTRSLPIIFYKGFAKFKEQQYEPALVYFKQAYVQHPTAISILNNLGSAYGQLNSIDSSIVYQRKSLDIFPHYERALTNLSKSFYLKKDFEKAYQVILCCDPKSENKEVGQIRRAIENKLLE